MTVRIRRKARLSTQRRFVLTGTTTLKAAAFLTDFLPSGAASATFTVQ